MDQKPIKKIVFIEPKAPGYHIYLKWGLPRLGTIILGTILKQHGYDVKIFVEEIKPIDFEELFNADVVGISTITSTAPRAFEIANQVRKAGIPVFMGGPHVTFLPEEALKYADYVVRGEAEDTIVDLIKALETGTGIEKIPGLSYQMGHHIRHNEIPPFCADLDKYPIPDFSLIHGYNDADNQYEITPIQTSRGCPFDCNFCSVTEMFGKRYRYRSNDHVIQEIKEKKPEWIFFYDDNFTANKKRAKDFLQRMINENLVVPWSAQVRTDIVKDLELMELLKKSKCRQLYIGFESINPKALEEFKKSQSVDEIKEAIKIIHRYGIKIHGMFIFGAEHDDLDTFRKTVKFAKKMQIESVQFMILVPLPGTQLYHNIEKEGRLIPCDWSYYDGHHVVFKPNKISMLDLQVETVRSMIRFYSVRQILAGLNRFDIWTMLIRAYGYRFMRKWRKSNFEFVDQLKQFYQHAGNELHSAGHKIELKARKTTDDLIEAYQKYRPHIKSKMKSR
ncbi:MAG: radical SAM protein [Pseudomonadota bacterium]